MKVRSLSQLQPSEQVAASVTLRSKRTVAVQTWEVETGPIVGLFLVQAPGGFAFAANARSPTFVLGAVTALWDHPLGGPTPRRSFARPTIRASRSFWSVQTSVSDQGLPFTDTQESVGIVGVQPLDVQAPKKIVI